MFLISAFREHLLLCLPIDPFPAFDSGIEWVLARLDDGHQVSPLDQARMSASSRKHQVNRCRFFRDKLQQVVHRNQAAVDRAVGFIGNNQCVCAAKHCLPQGAQAAPGRADIGRRWTTFYKTTAAELPDRDLGKSLQSLDFAEIAFFQELAEIDLATGAGRPQG